MKLARLIKGAKDVVFYSGAPDGAYRHASGTVNEELLAFFRR
jgi:hypothetical protein